MITIKDLNRIKGILKISALCKLADVPLSTINDKMRDERELRIDESEKIEKIINSFGLFYNKDKEEKQ